MKDEVLKERQICFAGNTQAENLFIQMVDDHDLGLLEKEARALAEYSGREDWCIAAVPVSSWDQDLTPWKSEPVFGGRGFGDGAEETLRELTGTILPQIEKDYPAEGRKIYLCGYSLAGLFALWAAYQTDLFAGAAAVSPSVWYPGWMEYAASHPVKTGKIYLSLGDREEKARNKVMAAVGDCIRSQYRILDEAGICTRLDWNPGNHFVDSEKRVAKGLAWLLGCEAFSHAALCTEAHGREG